MKLFGFEIMKGQTISQLKGQFTEIEKKLKDYQKLRPEYQDLYRYAASDQNVRIPIYPIQEMTLYLVAMHSDIVRTIMNAVRDGIFRRGLEIEETSEFANEEQKEIIENLQKKANQNGQGIVAVCKQFEQDLNILDNAYLLAIKDYFFDDNGEIIPEFTTPKEILRVHPTKMRVIADDEGRMGYDENGEALYVSMDHRDKLVKEREIIKDNFIDEHGKKYQRAYYRAEKSDGNYLYMIKGEVLHQSKHNPSMLYGYSPLFAVWMKIFTLLQMDRYLMLAYQKGRPPRGAFIINTTNYESARKAWENLKSKTRENPHDIHPLLLENNKRTGKGTAEWIDFMRPLDEMQYIESRNEMRRAIGALYGVMPVFAADVQQSGGLNNEGQQIALTNRALEEGQKIYNDKVFPWILNLFGINDYVLKLAEPEERDETEDARRLGIKIDNAMKMANMGFGVTWNEEEETFDYSETQENPERGMRLPSADQPFLSSQQFGGEPSKSDGIDFEDVSNRIEKLRLQDFEKKVVKIVNIVKKDIQKEIKKDFEINKQTEEDFVKFISQALFDKKFEGLSKAKSDGVKAVLLTAAVKGESLQSVIEKIADLGIEKEQSETIARTEQQALQNQVREFNFIQAQEDGDEEFKYKWIGPADDRTSDICNDIKRQTKKGLTMENLRKTVREIALKHGEKDPREWTPHINCRHTFTRVI